MRILSYTLPKANVPFFFPWKYAELGPGARPRPRLLQSQVIDLWRIFQGGSRFDWNHLQRCGLFHPHEYPFTYYIQLYIYICVCIFLYTPKSYTESLSFTHGLYLRMLTSQLPPPLDVSIWAWFEELKGPPLHSKTTPPPRNDRCHRFLPPGCICLIVELKKLSAKKGRWFRWAPLSCWVEMFTQRVEHPLAFHFKVSKKTPPSGRISFSQHWLRPNWVLLGKNDSGGVHFV